MLSTSYHQHHSVNTVLQLNFQRYVSTGYKNQVGTWKPRHHCLRPWLTDPEAIWAATWQNQQSDFAPSEDSDQPWHPPSLIRVFAVRMKKALVLSYPLSASEDSDQTGRMPRLIWVFAGRTLTLLVLSCRGSYINEPCCCKIYLCRMFFNKDQQRKQIIKYLAVLDRSERRVYTFN